MDIDVILAKVVLTINKGGLIDSSLITDNLDVFNDPLSKIYLCNAILTPHKKRYLNCFTDELRQQESTMVVKNYMHAFIDTNIDFVDAEIIKSIFEFSVISDFTSLSFKNSCRSLLDNLKKCNVKEISYAMYKKITSLIIRCYLYGCEPYDSLLEECIENIDAIHLDSYIAGRIAFLE